MAKSEARWKEFQQRGEWVVKQRLIWRPRSSACSNLAKAWGECCME